MKTLDEIAGLLRTAKKQVVDANRQHVDAQTAVEMARRTVDRGTVRVTTFEKALLAAATGDNESVLRELAADEVEESAFQGKMSALRSGR